MLVYRYRISNTTSNNFESILDSFNHVAKVINNPVLMIEPIFHFFG